MQEYTPGVSLSNSISFTTNILFPISYNIVSLSKSSLETIIVHSFGEDKAVSHTEALKLIHIIVVRISRCF